MKNKQIFLLSLSTILTILLLGACAPSQAENDAISSQVAAEIFSSQTAQVPTATPTPTRTVTPIPTEAQISQLGNTNITPQTGENSDAAPRPTFTPTPTITLPDVVKDTLDNPEVLFGDDFDHGPIGNAPPVRPVGLFSTLTLWSAPVRSLRPTGALCWSAGVWNPRLDIGVCRPATSRPMSWLKKPLSARPWKRLG